MKNQYSRSVLVGVFLFCCSAIIAQEANLKLEVKGIKEAKGCIMLMIKDRANKDKVIYEKVDVVNNEDIICHIEHVPVGRVDISVFHDVNGNYKLDVNEQNIPIEPCYSNEKIRIKEGENQLTIKLQNVAEMMSKVSNID